MTGMCLGQLRSADRAAIKSMAKKRWEKAKEQLDHALEKDTLNAASKFLYSRYFFSATNPAFHIDSAYLYVNKALWDYGLAPAKERDRLARAFMDSLQMVRLRKRIDSAAFEKARSVNTEGAFLHFLSTYVSAEQRNEAIALRDEAAYLDAVKANTYQSFLHFIEKYPSAARAPEARSTYERLLYNTRTKERSLNSYENFLKEYPATPYRREVEKHIFEISTASGQISDFVNFLDRYGRSSSAGKARSILFHLLADHEQPVSLDASLTDSLRNVQALNEGFLFPVMKDGLFGFMNTIGEMVIRPGMETLYPAYKCGSIQEDVLIVNNALLSRDGRTIFRDSIEDLSDLGSGFLAIQTNECLRIVHKSGFSVNDCADEAKIVSGKFIAVKKNGRWALYTLAGRSLTLHDWDEIEFVEDLLIFKKGNEYRLVTAVDIGKSADSQDIEFSDPFDEVRMLEHSRLWVRSKDFEGVLDQRLQSVIPFDKYEIKSTFFGVVTRAPSGYRLFDIGGNEIAAARGVQIHEPWIALRQDKKWQLYDENPRMFAGVFFDSVRFEGPFVVGLTSDSLRVQFTPAVARSFKKNTQCTFVPGKDSTAFILIQEDRRKTLYDYHGKFLFTMDFDDVSYAGGGLFIVSRKDKKGLISRSGKVLLPVEFDAIGSVAGNMVSLLRNLKFGAYHVEKNKLIRPQYEKNVIIYNDDYLYTFQKGHYGFINWDNKPVTRFEFDEVRYWNDSAAVVKKNFNWLVYNISANKQLENDIKDIQYIIDTADEKLAIVKQHNSYGVVSSRQGFIIEPTFSNIVNVGTPDHPVYFTEKHVEEASIFVVIYYDSRGQMLYRQVYEEEDYEKILCSDK